MATIASHRPPYKPLDLEITIVSAKHLKNINWRNGDLKPYAIFWLDPDHRLATKSDDSNSTKPVWNERFLIPLLRPTPSSLSRSSTPNPDTPRPLVGTYASQSLTCLTPKIALSSEPSSYDVPLVDPTGGYYSQPPHPQTPMPFSDRPSSYGGGGGASAPMDYAQYEQKQRPEMVSPAVGAVAEGLGGLALDEGSRYEEEKIAGSDLKARELGDYTDYRRVDY